LIAFALNFFNQLRQQYIFENFECGVNAPSPASQTNSTLPLTTNSSYCDSFQYSVTISAGIGFVFLGNIYDNVEKPRQVTAVILLILSLISLVEGIFARSLIQDSVSSATTDQVVMTLY
jgi:hypothetical protein